MSTSTHPIIVPSNSDIEDAFSSTHTPDYTPASPDYFPASPGNTSPDPSDDLSKYLLASLAISPFHDDPYMKVMQAYNATSNESPIPPLQAPIAPPTVLPPSLVLPLSPMFDPQDFFLPEEILPPQKRACFLSSSSTNPPAQPQAIEIGENYHGAPDTSYARHEEQIKDILNHLDELSLDHIEEMKDKIEEKANGTPLDVNNDLQLSGLKMPPKRTSTSAAPVKYFRSIRQLVADSVVAALEAQAANMANTDNINRNPEPRETPAARKCTYKETASEICYWYSHRTCLVWLNSYAKPDLLNQKLTTPFQFKWLPKLLGYDYEIVYKKGSKNVVANALSRMDSSGEFLQISVSSVLSGVWDKVKDSWKNDLDIQNLIKSLEHHSYKGNKYSWTSEILKRKGKVVVGNDLELRKELVQHFHDEAIGGHSSAHVTMKKLGSLFYWKGLKKMVKQMVRDCDVCQRQKPDLSAYPGLIQPLPIPERIWKEISMDFIEKLPTSHGKSEILVVVDRLSKYAHFIPLAHPFTSSQVTQVLLDQVYKLHGLPESIVSDKDKVFLSNFWKVLFAELKVKLKLSTAYHPQTDDSRVEEVDKTLQARDEAIKMLKFHLKRIGEVAYRLELPSSSQIHPVFYISQLKKCHGKDHSVGVLPQLREDGLLENKPMTILERRLGKVNNKPVMFVLIQWTNKPVKEATWEIYGDLITRFPGFDALNEAVP
ncbi:retrotransposable element Tf2 [Tanacetum coccineum]